jgi:hypothetical protein
MHSKLFGIILFLTTSSCFAFFCPNNFNQIDFGNSIEQVQQQCGQANKQETKEIIEEGPQEWNYYIPQTVQLSNNQPAQGTLKTTVTFDSSGKAINISVNGIGVGNTTICGPLIQLGDTRDTVKSICGNPSFINKQNSTSASSEKKHTVTELTYSNIILVFENGQLKSKH